MASPVTAVMKEPLLAVKWELAGVHQAHLCHRTLKDVKNVSPIATYAIVLTHASSAQSLTKSISMVNAPCAL